MSHAHQPDVPATRNGGRILLAEDNPDTRAMLATALRLRGHEVVEVSDGIGLLYHALFGPRDVFDRPELIISDVRLPDWDGLEVLGLLRRADLQTPYVLITAFSDASIREDAERWGIAAFIAKPFDVEALCAQVQDMLPPR